eukprot:1160599-Pelagomonas_calceolata.AAC.6
MHVPGAHRSMPDAAEESIRHSDMHVQLKEAYARCISKGNISTTHRSMCPTVWLQLSHSLVLDGGTNTCDKQASKLESLVYDGARQGLLNLVFGGAVLNKDLQCLAFDCVGKQFGGGRLDQI